MAQMKKKKYWSQGDERCVCFIGVRTFEGIATCYCKKWKASHTTGFPLLVRKEHVGVLVSPARRAPPVPLEEGP